MPYLLQYSRVILILSTTSGIKAWPPKPGLTVMRSTRSHTARNFGIIAKEVSGLAFRPETSFAMIPKFLAVCDLVLLMTVSPGFGGQAFMPEVVDKIKMTREYCNKYGIHQGGIVKQGANMPLFDIQVDGGINVKTAQICVNAGANILVSGNHLFHQADMKRAIDHLRHCQGETP